MPDIATLTRLISFSIFGEIPDVKFMDLERVVHEIALVPVSFLGERESVIASEIIEPMRARADDCEQLQPYSNYS